MSKKKVRLMSRLSEIELFFARREAKGRRERRRTRQELAMLSRSLKYSGVQAVRHA